MKVFLRNIVTVLGNITILTLCGFNQNEDTMVDTSSGQVVAETVMRGQSTSVWDLFVGAEPVVQLIIIGLISASIWSWTIIFSKWWLLHQLREKTKIFERNFWKADSVSDAFDPARDTHPAGKIAAAVIQTWENTQDKKNISACIARIERSVAPIFYKTDTRLRKNLGFLSTLGATALLIGLFGTVWGIMHSFQSIAFAKNTSLAVVAPGIAEALFATALGLIAAIPAMIGYNRLSAKIAAFLAHLEQFLDHIMLTLEKNMDK